MAISRVSRASLIPLLLAGMLLSVHQVLNAVLSATPFLTGIPIGKCSGAYISQIFCMNPVESSSSIEATGIRLCMRIHFITFTSFLLDFLAEVLFRELTCACSSFLSAICFASGSTSSSLIYLLCLLPFSDH